MNGAWVEEREGVGGEGAGRVGRDGLGGGGGDGGLVKEDVDIVSGGDDAVGIGEEASGDDPGEGGVPEVVIGVGAGVPDGEEAAGHVGGGLGDGVEDGRFEGAVFEDELRTGDGVDWPGAVVVADPHVAAAVSLGVASFPATSEDAVAVGDGDVRGEELVVLEAVHVVVGGAEDLGGVVAASDEEGGGAGESGVGDGSGAVAVGAEVRGDDERGWVPDGGVGATFAVPGEVVDGGVTVGTGSAGGGEGDDAVDATFGDAVIEDANVGVDGGVVGAVDDEVAGAV